MDVFVVYIEMIQNICYYVNFKGYGEYEVVVMVVIVCNEDGYYVVFVGNLVECDDGQSLVCSIQVIVNFDKVVFKVVYKEQLCCLCDSGCVSGVGFGLLDIVCKFSELLVVLLKEQFDGCVFFSLCVVI